MCVQERLVDACDDADISVNFNIFVFELLYQIGREVDSLGIGHFLKHVHVDIIC